MADRIEAAARVLFEARIVLGAVPPPPPHSFTVNDVVTGLDLAAIRARADAATEGPWTFCVGNVWYGDVTDALRRVDAGVGVVVEQIRAALGEETP